MHEQHSVAAIGLSGYALWKSSKSFACLCEKPCTSSQKVERFVSRWFCVTARVGSHSFDTSRKACAALSFLHPTSLQNDHQSTDGCERSRLMRSRMSFSSSATDSAVLPPCPWLPP